MPTSSLYTRLLKQAGPRCGYCRTSAKIVGQPLTIEHIVPSARGGSSDEKNLWLSCRRCNQFKGTQIDAFDPGTGEFALLFNPRQQPWPEHFIWSGDGLHIIGLTPTGRATVIALRLNNDEIVAARWLWVSVGWHPPHD